MRNWPQHATPAGETNEAAHAKIINCRVAADWCCFCCISEWLEGRMNRRSLLGSTLLTVAALLKWPRSIGTALADDKNWRHGVSLFGDLKYPAGFRHFDYVNAGAPKGGTAREATSGTFDNFNGVSPALRARSPLALILSTRRFWYRRLTKYRADMVCLPKQ